MQKLNERLGDTLEVSPSLFVFYFYHWCNLNCDRTRLMYAGINWNYNSNVGMFTQSLYYPEYYYTDKYLNFDLYTGYYSHDVSSPHSFYHRPIELEFQSNDLNILAGGTSSDAYWGIGKPSGWSGIFCEHYPKAEAFGVYVVVGSTA